MIKTIFFIFALFCAGAVFADGDTCDTPSPIFTGSLDPSLFTKLQVTYSTSDLVIIPTISSTPSTTGKIEISVSSCSTIDISSWSLDLSNGVDSCLFTLAKKDASSGSSTTTGTGADKTVPATNGAGRTSVPLLSLALAALFVFPKNRLSLFLIFGFLVFASYTPITHAETTASPVTLYLNIALPAGVTVVCYNSECTVLSSPTNAPSSTSGTSTSSPTLAPTSSPSNPTTTTAVPTTVAPPAYSVRLRVLVIADVLVDPATMSWGSLYITDSLGADFVNRTFMSVGMPYDFIPTSSDLSSYLGTSSSTGQYSGIVYVKALTASISDTQQSIITTYQQKFNVKLVVVGSKPAGLPGLASAGSSTTAAGNVYVASGLTKYTKTLKTDAKINVQAINNWQSSYNTVQPGKITDASLATAAIMFQPTGGSEVVAAAIVKVSGTEQLHYFIAQCTSNLHSWALAPLMLNFISPGGVFVGARRLTLSVQPDDLFLAGFLWDTTTHAAATADTVKTKPELLFRLSGSDLQAAADWLDAKNAELGSDSYISIEWPFNGYGSNNGAEPASGAFFDVRFAGTDLFNVTMKNYEKFWFITHTWSHPCPDFDTASYDLVNQQISYNNIWASSSFLPQGLDNPRMSKECMVSPCITGLHNPNFWKAVANNGIKYQVGDNSVAYQTSPRTNPYHLNYTTLADNGFEGGVIIPREVYTIDVSSSTPEDYTDSWNTALSRTDDFETALADPVNQGFFDLMGYRQDPHMFHEASVRAFSYADPKKGKTVTTSLVTLWMDRVIDQVRTYFDLPIRSPKYSDLADIWMNRMTMDACGFEIDLAIDKNNQITGFTATSTGTCVVQLTGVSLATSSTVKMETYGADTTALVSMTAGVKQTLTLTTPIAL